MDRLPMEAFCNDPALRHRLYAEAHRLRAMTMHAALSRLFKSIKARLTPRDRICPSCWIRQLG